MKIKIKKTSKFAVTPTKMTEGAAAYDLYTADAFTVREGRNMIPTDIAIELPVGYEAKIEPRSGLSVKGMIDAHDERKDADVIVGKIDSDYRGNIHIILKSYEKYPFTIARNTRIAQLTIYKVEDADFVETSELSETERGLKGFGSTKE